MILIIAKREHGRGSKKITPQALAGDAISERQDIATDSTAIVTNNDETDKPVDDNDIGERTNGVGDRFSGLQSGDMGSGNEGSTINELQVDEATAFDVEMRHRTGDAAVDLPTIALIEEKDTSAADDAVVGSIINVLPAEGSIDSAATESIDGKVTEAGHEMEATGNKMTTEQNKNDSYIVTEL